MKGKRRIYDGPRTRVGFRLGGNDRDRYLAEQLERVRRENTNVSELIKNLLCAYFKGELSTFDQSSVQPAAAVIDRRTDAVRAKLLGLSFDDLEKRSPVVQRRGDVLAASP
jgi:hypothetical protein